VKKYRLIKELLPVGTLLDAPAPTKTERRTVCYEVLIAIGKDYTASFVVDAEAVENNPEFFKEITE
jgi:hypothetical protein